MSGILDRLPASVRHFLFSVGAILALAGLDWLQANYTTLNIPQPIIGIIAMLIPVAVAYLTPITNQYGVGAADIANAVNGTDTQQGA
jgi:hypothetical protein